MIVKKYLYSAVVTGLLLLGSLAMYAYLPVSLFGDGMIARAEVFKCRDSVDEKEKEICYQKNVPDLMDDGLSMERTFDVVRRVLTLDSGFKSCHVLAHLISGKEVARDPLNWKDVITRVPLTICGSGALHGAFQERFREESLPDASVAELGEMLEGACDEREGWSPTSLDRSGCMHGMGHLFLYVTDANVKKSVSLCESLAIRPDGDFRQTCLEGAFMQVYQPLEPEDEVLIHAIKEESHQTKRFCGQFMGLAYNACIKEGWTINPDIARVPEVFEAFCSQLRPKEAANYCASAIMYPVIEVLQYDVPVIMAFCRALSDPEFESTCWARTATKFVWANSQFTDQALSICVATPDEFKDRCWQELASYAEQGMAKGSADVKNLCTGMPEPYKTQCLDQTSVRL